MNCGPNPSTDTMHPQDFVGRSSMKNSNHILVIEDDPDARSGLCDILALDGFETLAVGTFADAIEVCKTRRFGVVLSDRRLPDGLVDDHLASLKSVAEDAEILVVTGYGDIESTIEAFRQGVSDYVTKPIVPEELIRTVRRIAEQRRLQLQLRQEQSFTKHVLQTAEAIVVAVGNDSRIVRSNRFFERLTGCTADETVGRDWFEHFVTEEHRQIMRDAFRTAIDGTEHRGVVGGLRLSNDRVAEVRWSITRLIDPDKEVPIVLAIGIDITDLLEANRKALRSQRLAAIGQTMTALAHESRNALQRIQAATDVLALEVEGLPEASTDLAAIRRASEDLRSLLENVRSFAAPIQVALQTRDLPDVWRQAWDDLGDARKQRDAELSETFHDDAIEVRVDAVRMKQVFLNLFANALEAASDPVRIHLDCRRKGHSVVVRIDDNGPGFGPDEVDHFFEPFFTTKSAGTGLGLPICRRIVEAHGGTIIACDAADGGCFVITLPVEPNR